MTKHKLHSLIFTFIVAILIAACANMGTPDGGPYDETPPKVVSTNPVFGAVNAKSRKITLMFDENVKITNASEKVIVSPPQIEQPEIDATGRRITVELLDSLQPGLTYTIDFADAIEDNNEGNPMGDYAFTFSTGDHIDTMQISGHVLDASNLEPIKGMLVGLYAITSDSLTSDSLAKEFPDSIFRTQPFQRISRTDSRGHFVIKGIAPGNYRVYALQDQDQTYTFSQRSEMMAFTDRIITPSSRPDIRPDTVWHDSIHYDSIVWTPYTHFFPDDIALLAFTHPVDDHYLLKSERPTLNYFTTYFTAKQDTLPVIKGLNFDSDGAFHLQASEHNDTLTYWIRDSLIYMQDTLSFEYTYYATDTLGQLTLQTDTIDLVSKVTRTKYEKQKANELTEWADQYREQYKREHRDDRDADGKRIKYKDEDIDIPPMPEKFMDVKTGNSQLDPDKNIDFTFPEPIDTLYADMFHLKEKVDSLFEERDFLIEPFGSNGMQYRLFAEWKPGSTYELLIDTGAVVSIYGNRMAGSKKSIKIKELESYSTLFITLEGADTSAVVQLLNQSDSPVKEVKAEGGKATFYFINPGTYYLRLYYDHNGNGIWDPGNYDEHRQAEETYYYPGAFTLKANWDINQTWNPTATQVSKQKPSKITKQKPEKEKQQKSRNAEREAKKKGKSGKNNQDRGNRDSSFDMNNQQYGSY